MFPRVDGSNATDGGGLWRLPRGGEGPHCEGELLSREMGSCNSLGPIADMHIYMYIMYMYPSWCLHISLLGIHMGRLIHVLGDTL